MNVSLLIIPPDKPHSSTSKCTTWEFQNHTYPLQRLVALRCGLLDSISVGFTSCKHTDSTLSISIACTHFHLDVTCVLKLFTRHFSHLKLSKHFKDYLQLPVLNTTIAIPMNPMCNVLVKLSSLHKTIYIVV